MAIVTPDIIIVLISSERSERGKNVENVENSRNVYICILFNEYAYDLPQMLNTASAY